MTERTLLEDQLLQADKLQSIGQLASAVAHDFNNLLTGILGAAELALIRLGREHPSRASVHQITEYAHHASELTRQLLGFARKKPECVQIVDLNELVEQTSRLLDRLIGDRIEIRTELDPDLDAVAMDPGRMQQVLLNLSINARDAMPRGGTLTLSTANQPSLGTPDRPEGAVVLSVSDTGVGMTDEALSHLFEPFFTTKGLGRGTGLGLTTCRAVVEQAGGRIEVESRTELGTTFRIHLPRAARLPQSDVVPVTTQRRLRGMETLLLVDDDDAVRWSTAELLRHLGYSVVTAGSGLEALSLAERHAGPIHAVIVDVRMRDLGGPDVVRLLRATRKDIDALYISGDEVALQQLPAGAVVLSKPLDTNELAAAIRTLVDERPSVRATGT